MLQRVVRYALREELQALEQERTTDRASIEALGDDSRRLADELRQLQEAAGRDLGSQAQDIRRLQEAHDSLQRHLETRHDQTGAELTDLRSAFLVTRAELGALRDDTAPALASRLDALADESARLGAALQKEVEGLRDIRVPAAESAVGSLQAAVTALQAEVEGVRDTGLRALETELSRVHGDLNVLQGELEGLRDQRVHRLESDLKSLHGELVGLQGEVEGLRDRRLVQTEGDLRSLQAGLSGVLAEVERIRDRRLPLLSDGLANAQVALEGVQSLGEELRDRRLPALDGRVSALVERLHEDLAGTAGLVDRMLHREPLRVAAAAGAEPALPEAMLKASRQFVDAFRGSPEEIRERLGEYLPTLREAAPVLDLGCGRGELLTLLQRHGVAARGVDADPAMVEACRAQGLDVEEADAIASLKRENPGSLGAVTAVQLVEHLPAAAWMELVDAAARALRTDGVLLIECPNPASLRVGGSLFWLDPTHRAPVHPEAVAFVARAVGLRVQEIRFLHAFPSEQELARPGQSAEVHELARRLDAVLSAPRDFVVLARKP